MKKNFLCSLCFISFFLADAQIIPIKNSFQSDIAKVITDYPNHFKNLLGDIQVENPQSTDYKSKLVLKDAQECLITKYSSGKKEIFSWQALMMKTEDFDEAVKNFHNWYNSLNNLSVNSDGAKIVFSADYLKPTEAKKFASIIFLPNNKIKENLKIRVELLLQAEMMEWTIKILVYEKEKEDDERGPQKEQ